MKGAMSHNPIVYASSNMNATKARALVNAIE